MSMIACHLKNYMRCKRYRALCSSRINKVDDRVVSVEFALLTSNFVPYRSLNDFWIRCKQPKHAKRTIMARHVKNFLRSKRYRAL